MNNQEQINNLYEMIKELKDVNERKDILDDLEKIKEYKLFIISTKSTKKEIKNFISNTIDKYRDKRLILSDYYNSDKDHILPNDVQMLNLIENMIKQYVLRKSILDEVTKNSNSQ